MERRILLATMFVVTAVLTESQAFEASKLPRDENWPYRYVSVGPAGVWAVNRDNKLFYRTGTYWNNGETGSGWQYKTDNVLQVDVGRENVAYVTNKGEELFWIPGISKNNPFGDSPKSWEWWTRFVALAPRDDTKNSLLVDARGDVLCYHGEPHLWIWLGRLRRWQYQDIKADTVSQGLAGMWATKGKLMYKTGTFSDLEAWGSGWVTVDDGQFQHVTSGSGAVLAVRENGELVQRTGVTCSSPTGSGWVARMPGMSRVDSYGAVAWAVDTSGDLHFIEL